MLTTVVGINRNNDQRPIADVLVADGGFFVFGDLSVKVEGEYRLRFSLFEMRKYVTRFLISFS